MKKCSKCGKVKPLSEFNKDSKHRDGLRASCRVCRKKQEHNHRKKKGKDYYSNKHLTNTYGITLEDKAKMYLEQDGKCYICDKPIEGHKVYIDHDHKTGKVRKLLCPGCNCAIGLAQESEELLLKFIAYLKEHKED
jgi:hypothetical protein